MLPHHVKLDRAINRPPYRQGAEFKAVKVYTVNNESIYLLIQGVPAVNVSAELINTFAQYGNLLAHSRLNDYPITEKFTEVYLIKYDKISSARIAKRRLDDLSFYGGVLHVCYAPEYEDINDTRAKLQERRKAIARKCDQFANENEKDWHTRKDAKSALVRRKSFLDHGLNPTTSSVTKQHQAAPIEGSDNSVMSLHISQSDPRTDTHSDEPHLDNPYTASTSQLAPSRSMDIPSATFWKTTESANKQTTNSEYESGKRKIKPIHSAAQAAVWHKSTFQPVLVVPDRPKEKHYLRELGPQPPNKKQRDACDISNLTDTSRATSADRIQPHQPELIRTTMIIREVPVKPVTYFVPRQLKSAMDTAADAHQVTVRTNAKLLRDKQGPDLPKDVSESYRDNSGQCIANQTTLEIRSKVTKFSA